MKIAFLASEVVPFAKTGGLADVSGALPKELAYLGNDVKVFMPKYYSVDENKFNLQRLKNIGEMRINIVGKLLPVLVFRGFLPDTEVEIYFLDYPPFFNRDQIYTNDPDEADRFILFSKGVIELIQLLNWKPDIIHCNDWQTGLIPLLLKDNYRSNKTFEKTASVLTIHNIGYQGIFNIETLDKAEIKPIYFENHGEVEKDGQVNFLKAGISFADIINTVSENYAKELLTPEYGHGLDDVLNNRTKDFFGILNGVDYNIWNPETDKYLSHNYSLNNLTGKDENKKLLLKKFNLPIKPNVPLIGIISRFAVQKGFDIILSSMEYLLSLNAQWVVLGTGETEYEEEFSKLAKDHPDKLSLFVGYNNELSHLIEAGADMFLMPSHYEPCGLNQIYSLKYGTVPIVRNTGGLADTVQDWDYSVSKGEESGTGYSFNDYNGYSLTDAVERAIRDFNNKPTWKKIQSNGMNKDYSWKKSAKKYVELYKKGLANKLRNTD